MPRLFNVHHHGPRTVVVVSSLAGIVLYFVRLYGELVKIEDLPSDTMMTPLKSKVLGAIFVSVIQLLRIVACFTSRTILVQLAFYIWTIEGVFKSILILATIVIVSFKNDLNDKIQAWRVANSQGPHLMPMFPVTFYVSFVVGVGLKMILNELRKRDDDIQHQRELLFRLEKEMPPLPATITRSPASSMVQSLTESEVQRRLLRVRTWPRIVIGLNFAFTVFITLAIAFESRGKVFDVPWDSCALNAFAVVSGPLGLYALLRKSLPASRWVLWLTVLPAIYEVYNRINDFVSMYTQEHQSVALRFTATVSITKDSSAGDKVTFAHLVGFFIFTTVLDLIIAWSIWQVVKDLEKRDRRVAETMAKAKVDSVATNSDNKLDASCNKDSHQQSPVVVDIPVAESA